MRYKLGKFIEEINLRNTENEYDEKSVRGISTGKKFISTKANLKGDNLSSYKIVPSKCFAYVPDTSRRGDKISLAYNNTGSSVIVSSISTVFKVTHKDKLLPDFLNIFFKRPEFDRYARFNSWGSARETFDFESLCETFIEVPSYKKQLELSSIYNGIYSNINSFSLGSDDISVVIESSIDNLKKSSKKVHVGELMKNIDVRNSNNEYNTVLGININKEFIPSNLKSSVLTNYKVIKTRQFAYNSMQTGRDNCIRIAFYEMEEPALVSPSYSVLEVISDEVIPEYIQMWFSRRESDRKGAFMTDASIRANLDLQRFLETEIPVPQLEVQQAVVNLFLVKQKRKKIVNALEEEFSKICQVLFKGAYI